MTDQKLREALKRGEIYNQYILIGDEPLLIDNTIKAIKDNLNVNESFDCDTFFITEVAVEDIFLKMYLTPFASARRLLIIKNLEELDEKELIHFTREMSKIRTSNCVVMIYAMEKGARRTDSKYRKLANLLPGAQCITFAPDQEIVDQWVRNKIKRDNLVLSSAMVHYLQNEFTNDITGLKNEFEKIENYLYEAKTLGLDDMKDLAKGLCDFDKYQWAVEFFEGRANSLANFEELRPYLHSYSEIVDALTRGLVRSLKTKNHVLENNSSIKDVVDEIVTIDRKIKVSSYFSHLLLEIFLITKADLFGKGVSHGRKMA